MNKDSNVRGNRTRPHLWSWRRMISGTIVRITPKFLSKRAGLVCRYNEIPFIDSIIDMGAS